MSRSRSWPTSAPVTVAAGVAKLAKTADLVVPLIISCASGKRRVVSVGGKGMTVTVTDPSDALERGSGRAARLFSAAFVLANGLGRDSVFPCAFPVIAENVAKNKKQKKKKGGGRQ